MASWKSNIEDTDAEWQTRKISLLGAAKSVVSQLSVGQDLTKVSLPSVFCYPYSALELGGYRSLAYVDIMLQSNQEKDSTKRMLGVIRWFLTCVQKERFEKKPYNPVLGETHYCWTESKFGTTTYRAEQVSHHPPISAYTFSNLNEEMTAVTNVSFSVKFHGNSVSVGTQGPFRLHLGKHNESYHFSQGLPDLAIKNVILGTKRIAWDGEISVECPQTNLKVVMTFKEEGWSNTNVVLGTVYNNNNPIYYFGGPCGGTVHIIPHSINGTPPQKTKNVADGEVLLNYSQLSRNIIKYPSLEEMEPNASMRLWKEVSDAIIEDDMNKADNAKRFIEEEQRRFRNEGTAHSCKFFGFDSSSEIWEPTEASDTKETSIPENDQTGSNQAGIS